MTDELKWYMDTRKWRKSHEINPEMMEHYDNVWYDRVMILTVIALIIGVIAGSRIKFLFI